MPSNAVAVPQYPRYMDLKDATDSVDRELESALASAAIVQAALMTIAPPGGTDLVPKHVTPANLSAYQSAVEDARDAIATVVLNLKKACVTL